MARVLKLRRGTTAEHSTFTGAEGEVTVDTTTDSLVVHDNVTVGGHRQASEAYVNAAIANIGDVTANTGNVSFSNVTISTSLANANLVLDPNGTGIVEAAANLHVTSNAMLLGSSDEVAIRYRAAGEAANPWKRAQLTTAHNGNANVAITIFSNDTTYMFFNPLTGNIGVNTNTPAETFTVNGNIRSTHVNVESDYDGGFRFYGADVTGLTGLFHINSNVQHTLSLVHNGQEYLSADVNGWVTGGNIQVFNNFNVGGEADLPGNTYVGLRTSFIAAQANLQYAGDQDTYLQFVMQNKSSSAVTSTDIVATADNGTDFDTFIDMGINSSTYNAVGQGLHHPNDGYLLVVGNTTTGGGNLVISTVENNDIVFSTGGVDTANEMARFQHGVGLVVSANVIPAANVTYNLGEPGAEWNSLHVSGNTIYIGGVPLSVDNSGNLFVNGNAVAGGGAANTGDVTFNGVKIIGAGTASGDGLGYSTLELVPDGTLVSDQYIVVDPTAPNHIHLRAGGTQDASTAALFLGGELNYARVTDGYGVRLNNAQYIPDSAYFEQGVDYDTATWSTDESGNHWIDIIISDPFNPTRNPDPINIAGSRFSQYPTRNSIEVFTGSSLFTVTGNGQAYTLGNPYNYRIGTVEAPPANPTTLASLDYRLNTFNERYLYLENNAFETYADTVSVFSNQTIDLVTGTGNFRITTDDNNSSYSWYFTAQGYLQFPQGLGPTTSKGKAGDEAGSVVVDADYIYYCHTDYTDGIADIWKRTPWSQTTW